MGLHHRTLTLLLCACSVEEEIADGAATKGDFLDNETRRPVPDFAAMDSVIVSGQMLEQRFIYLDQQPAGLAFVKLATSLGVRVDLLTDEPLHVGGFRGTEPDTYPAVLPQGAHVHASRQPELMWIRDWGPIPFYEGHTLKWLLSAYQGGRDSRTAIETVAETMDVEYVTSGVAMQGGDIQTDGSRCFVTAFASSFASSFAGLANMEHPPDIEAELREQLGCMEVIALREPKFSNVGHLDEVIIFLDQNTVAVAALNIDRAFQADDLTDEERSSLETDRNNQDWNALKLAALGYTVLRVPTPPVPKKRPPDAGRLAEIRPTRIASHVNALVLNGHLLMPVFHQHVYPPEQMKTVEAIEDEAFAVFADHFGGENVHRVEAGVWMDFDGAIHCVTRATPLPQSRE